MTDPKDAALQSALCEGREEALDGVEPRGGRWCEMERPSWVAVEPLADPWMLMSRVVVENGVDRLSRRNLLLDGVQKADELLMAMPLHVATNHRAVEHVERGEQRRRAVTLVVVRHSPGAPLL